MIHGVSHQCLISNVLVDTDILQGNAVRHSTIRDDLIAEANQLGVYSKYQSIV